MRMLSRRSRFQFQVNQRTQAGRSWARKKAENSGAKEGEPMGQEDRDVKLEPIQWADALLEVRKDFEDNYFVSGDAEMHAYEDDCEFADPFTSFRGVKRFKRNLSNFGKVIEDVDVAITDWREVGDYELNVAWRFRCTVCLPWRPLLAAAGNTTYIGNPETGLICRHIEAWDSDVGKVLWRLLRPGKTRRI